MKNKSLHKQIWIIVTAVLTVLLICGGIYLSATAYDERAAIISSDGDNVNVRTDAGTGYGVVVSLTDKTDVTIIGEKLASDGSKWYEIRFVVNGETKTGFMHSAYVIYKDYSGLDEVEQKSFEELLAEFPESYKNALMILHDMYPKWKFVAQHTGLEWSDALREESSRGRSLVSTGAISSWKSTVGDAYNWNTGVWKGMDGEKWVTASEEIVAYYLDPRNYLDGSMIFAFITHQYDGNDQTLEGVRSIIGKSFMSVNFVEGNTEYEYASLLMEAGRTYGVSPYVLAAMMRIELGYNGSGSVSGTEQGYENLYNYYNVGAYATANMTAIQRGLWYAGGEGAGKTSYGRPWNTRYKAIMGGAEFYATNYVNGGQNSLYLKRFNVMTDNPYTHQYMTNIQGAASEANVYSLAYNAEAKQQNLVFYIPIYNNMPEIPAVKPTKTGSPNNKLDSISVDGTVLTEFDMDKNQYELEVEGDVESIVLSATPKDSTASIQGIGETILAVGENELTISVTAQNGDVRDYILVINRKADKDATLAELSVTGIQVTPEFDPAVLEYWVTIPEDQTTLEVIAAAASSQAVVEITAEEEIPVGESVVAVKVTAGDGENVLEYIINVSRPEAVDATLSELSVNGVQLTPAFDPSIEEYSIMVSTDQTALEVIATATSTYASVEIIGAEEIPEGQSVVVIKVTSGNESVVKEYRIHVEKPVVKEDVTVESEKFTIGENKYITGLTELPVTAETLLAGLTVNGGTAVITAADGVSEVTSVGTGAMVKVYDEDGLLCDVYTVVIYGDVSGDGVIDDIDFLRILKTVMGYTEQIGVYAEAADLNRNGEVDDIDFLRMLKHVMGYENSVILQ